MNSRPAEILKTDASVGPLGVADHSYRYRGATTAVLR